VAEPSSRALPFFPETSNFGEVDHPAGEYIDWSDYKVFNPFSGYENMVSRGSMSSEKKYQSNRKGSNRLVYPSQDIDYDKYRESALEYAGRLISNGWKASLPKEKLLARHVAFCKTKLMIWETYTQGTKVLSKEEVLYSSLTEGPAFAKFLKKARNYTHIKFFSVNNIEFDEDYLFDEWDHVDSLPGTDDLIHWTEVSDDYEWMFTEVDKFPDASKSFKYHFKRHLDYLKVPPEKVKEAQTISLEECYKNSKCFVPGQKRTEYNKVVLDDSPPEEGYYGRRTLIQVGPANARDVVIPDGDTKVKVKMLDNVFNVFSQADKWCLSASGIDKVSRIRNLLRCNIFFHLDLKKEGLTFPRYLIKIAAECIEEKYNVNLSNIVDFEDLFVEIDNITYETKRGRSLGWGNQMCSVILSCLIQAFLWQFNEASEKYFGVIYTDDIIIGSFTSDERYQSMHSVEIISLLNDFLSRYGFIVGYKKCYGSTSATILGTTYSKESRELFTDPWGTPLALQPHEKTYSTADKWRMFAKALHAKNHVEAKNFVNLALLGFTKDLQEPIDFAFYIAVQWGPEFDGKVDEWDLPFRGGGWFTPIDENLDDSYGKESNLPFIVAFNDIDIPIISIPQQEETNFKNPLRRRRRLENAHQRTANVGEEMKEAIAEADPIFVSMAASGEMRSIVELRGTAFWNAHRQFCEKFNILSDTIGEHKSVPRKPKKRR
jgi:hypothetical protein